MRSKNSTQGRKKFWIRYGAVVMAGVFQLTLASGCSSERSQYTDTLMGSDTGDDLLAGSIGDGEETATSRTLALDGLSKDAASGNEKKLTAAILDLDKKLTDKDVPFAVRDKNAVVGDTDYSRGEKDRLAQEEKQRQQLVAENERILTQATRQLSKAPKLAALPKARKAKKAAKPLLLAKKSQHTSKPLRLAKRTPTKHTKKAPLLAQAPRPMAAPKFERWRPDPMPAAPLVAALAPAAPVVAPIVAPPSVAAKPAPKVEGAKLASLDVGQTVTKHIGTAFVVGGALLLVLLLLLRRSRKDEELDW